MITALQSIKTRINREFDAIRTNGHGFVSMNLDALSPEGILAVLDGWRTQTGPGALGYSRILQTLIRVTF